MLGTGAECHSVEHRECVRQQLVEGDVDAVDVCLLGLIYKVLITLPVLACKKGGRVLIVIDLVVNFSEIHIPVPTGQRL